MKLSFYGAAHEVTGSCFLISACGKNILVECGMEQGPDIYENQTLPVLPKDIDAVLLTHAHIDHSGNLPLLYKEGFYGIIYATRATVDLATIMLRDSAHIQEFEAEWKNRKAKRAGREEVEPIYTMDDALGALECMFPMDYRVEKEIFPGIRICFTDVGHLLGSASIEVWIAEDGIEKKLVFSGDIGNVNQPIIKDPQYLDAADYIIMESTYGNRSHGEAPDYIKSLTDIIQRTLDRGGNVVIPSFAVGRTQELLYFIREIKDKELVKGHGDFPVYVDSPLAIEATNIFSKNVTCCFDEETMALVNRGQNPISFPGLHCTTTSEESKGINLSSTPKVIISSSGMCEAGRIRHHLKHNLWRKECTVLFVGYQAVNTTGRSLLDGAAEVHLFGESITVHAEIATLEGISGHADDKGLMRWAEHFKECRPNAFVIHGEDTVCDFFAARLHDELGYHAIAPYSGDVFDLETGECLVEGHPRRIERREKQKGSLVQQPTPYTDLLDAVNALELLARTYQGRNDKKIEEFTEQIKRMAKKYR